MEEQDNQTQEQEPITTRTITHEGDKEIETTITKKGNKTTTHIITKTEGEDYDDIMQINLKPNEYVLESKESDYIDLPVSELIIERERLENGQNKKGNMIINKKMEIEELETDIKEEEERKKIIMRNENDIEINSILYDSNSHYSNEIIDEKEKFSNNISSNFNCNKYVNISRNNNIKYTSFDNSDEFKNISNGANDITEEEIFNLSAKLIQSAFRGYLLRKIFFINMQVYLNYNWSFGVLDRILKRKFRKKFFYNLKLYIFQNKKRFIKNNLNINVNRLPKIFIKKRYVLLSQLKKIKTESFSYINSTSSIPKKIIKDYNKKKSNEIISKNLIITNEELQVELLKLKKENEKLKEENELLKDENEFLKNDSEHLNKVTNEFYQTYKEIKINYVMKDEDGNYINKKDETIFEQPKNISEIFKKLEKELRDSNNYIEKLKHENNEFDDKIDNMLSDMKKIIEKQEEITKENKNKKEIEIENKLISINKTLKEMSEKNKSKEENENKNKINENEIKNIKDKDDIIQKLQEEIKELKKENEKLKNIIKEHKNPLTGSSLTFGNINDDEIGKKIDDFLTKSKIYYDSKKSDEIIYESKDFNNQSISFNNIYSLLQDSKEKLNDNKNEINELKKKNEELKNSLRESFIDIKKKKENDKDEKEKEKDNNKNDLILELQNENQLLKDKINIIIKEKNNEIEKLRDQCKKALSLSDKIQKNKLLKEIEQDAINKGKEERKLLQEMSSQRKKIPFEEINEVKKENVKLKEQINQLQNEIDLLNKRYQLRIKENKTIDTNDKIKDKEKNIDNHQNNENLQNEINELKKSCDQLKTELHQEKEFTDKFKDEKKQLHQKMRENIIRQLLFNYIRREEKSLRYNFNRFSRACLEKSLMKKYSYLSKEKLKEIYLKNLVQNLIKDKKHYLRKYFMKFYTNGIVREMNMTNSQKKALEKRRSEWKIKYEKEKLAEQYEKDHPEEAKKLREELKKLEEEEEKKNNEHPSIISPVLTEDEKIDLARKKYLKDLVNKKIKERAHYIHNMFTKFYYRGLLFKMKYGDKLNEKFGIKNEEENKEKKPIQKSKSELEEKLPEPEIDLEHLTPEQKLEEQRRRARALRKQLKDKKEEEKRLEEEKEKKEKEKEKEDNKNNIDIENEDEEIEEKKGKTMKGKDNINENNNNENDDNYKKPDREKTVRELELEELLSKFLYKKERADKASMKSDLTKWNYRAKLIKMKAMKIVRRNKNKDKKGKKKIKKKNESEDNEILLNNIEGNFTGDDNSNNNIKLKSINPKFNYKEIQREIPYDETYEKNDDNYFGYDNEDDDYVYDLIDINEEIQKHIKLSELIKKKIYYPIKKCLNHWDDITKFEKIKYKYMDSLKKNLGDIIEDEESLISKDIKSEKLSLNPLFSSNKSTMSARKNLYSTIGITMLKKVFRKIVIRKHYKEFLNKYFMNNKIKSINKIVNEKNQKNKKYSDKIVNLVTILTSPNFNLFTSIIKLTDTADKNILKIIAKKAKKKLINYFKELKSKNIRKIQIKKNEDEFEDEEYENEDDDNEIIKDSKTILKSKKKITNKKKK